MCTTPRRASSVYSEDGAFSLEGTLFRLSLQTSLQEGREISLLTEENEKFRREIAHLRYVWKYIYRIMKEINDAYLYLTRIFQEGEIRMEKERQKWVANCTVI
jgi:hypothetical protein